MLSPRKLPWLLPLLAPLAFAGDAAAGPTETASFTGAAPLTRVKWEQSAYGSRGALGNSYYVLYQNGQIADFAAPLDHALALQLTGTGWGCRMTMQVFDGTGNSWNSTPTGAWSFTADHFPFEYVATGSALFALNPIGGWGIQTRKIRVFPSTGHQPAGKNCTGGAQDSVITFIAIGQYSSVLTGVQAPPIVLYQSWPGPVTKGTTFQLTVKGTGPVIEPVTVTLSGKAIPNAAHAVTATVPLVAAAGSATTGVFFPATATGTTMQAFPDLAKLPPGKYVFDLEVKGASTQIPSNQTISDGAALAMRQGRPGPASYVGALLNTVTSRVRVEVTAPPPATGATMTSISSGAVGYFVGDPEQLAVAGTPGDLGTCDSYGLQLAAVTGGTGQSLTFKKKTFPETLSSGADFTALGNGVWQALATPSGVACTGKPDDALVQVETPSGSFVKDRPTLTMGQAAFVAQMATLTVTMPASYVAPNLACCDTELYFKNKAGSWAPYNATINRNFSDSDDSSSASFAGIITYAEFMQNPAAVEWALRVRATAPGQQFAWSNLARFTVQ